MKYLKMLKRIVCIILSVMVISSIFYSSIVYYASGTSTLVGESLETMTGTNKRGIEQIGLDVLEDLILGGILGGIGSKIKIKGLNAGRNNYQAIFAGGITRLVNGTGAMHLKTLLKGYIAQLVESIRDGVAGEIYDYIKTELFGCGEA